MNGPLIEQKEIVLQKSLDNNIQELRAEIIEIGSDILNENPVESYLLYIKRLSKGHRFSYLSSLFRTKNEILTSRYGTKAKILFNKLALVLSIKVSLAGIENQAFPYSVRILFHQWFERVLKDLSQLPDTYYQHSNNLFIKDFAVCSLMGIPVGGAWFVEVDRIGIKGFIFGDGIKQFFKYFKTVIFETYGFKPFYSVHVYERYMPRFTAEELEKAYFRINELLILNPRIKGICRASWLLDPQLKKICPHLEFNRRIPEENGAVMFQIGTTKDAKKNAISVSPKRKQLYMTGKYIPVVHALIWSRQKFFSWVGNQMIN